VEVGDSSARESRMLQRMRLKNMHRKALATALLACLLSACDRAVLDPAGDIARQQRDLIYISTGLMLLIIIPVMILIVVFAWRYRKGGRGTYDPKFDHSASLELAIWSAPLLIIIALGALTWSSTHLLDPFRAIPAKDGKSPLVVQVVSLDWKWLFIYPEQGIATVNELALPVGRPVRFDITSSNMMNTFYAPTLAGMIYAMPGMQSQLHAVLTRPVESQGYSANYSGAGFSDMRFALKGLEEAAFAEWVAAARRSGRAFGNDAYRELLAPSERVPAMHFSSIDPDLYRRILERCVEPGSPCISTTMHASGHGQESQGEPRP
jgi:cytochrome o ubiquinol oxidase subunit 2